VQGKYLLTLLTIAFVTLSGCASIPKETNHDKVAHIKGFPPPEKGKAGVYIFRDGIFGSALKKDLWIDGKCIGESASNTFFYIQVQGNREHTITTESEFSPNSLTIKTDAGKNYFIRQYIKMGVFVGGADLELVAPNEAKPIIQKLDLAKPGICSSTP